jgi:hypothetical protein
MTSNSNNDSAKCKQQSTSGNSLLGRVVGAIVLLAFLWLLFGSRISYAVAECSKGTGQCITGIAVALGVVDVYDKNDRCTGVGCYF